MKDGGSLRVMSFEALKADAHARARVLTEHVRTKAYIKDEEACLDKHPRDWPFGGEPMLVAAETIGASPQETNEVSMIGCAGCNLDCWFCFAREALKDTGAQATVANEDLRAALCHSDAFVHRISGGEPFLQLEEVVQFLCDAEDSYYWWIDTNLAVNLAAYDLIELELLSRDLPLGICGCFKGFTDEDVSINTGTELRLKDQLHVAKVLWGSGLDMFFYVVDAGLHPSGCGRSKGQKVREFIGLLRGEVHPNAPLRTVPIAIHEYECATGERPPSVIVNEFAEHWMDGLRAFYSPAEILAPLHLVPNETGRP